MSNPSRIQFTLPVIFWLTSLVAASLAAFGPGGVILASSVVIFWACVYSGLDRANRLLFAFGVVVLLLLLLTLMLPAVRSTREAARRTQCTNNLKMILLGLINYESAHGHLPPNMITDDEGTPLHSWRVLILPYLDEQRLYEQYRFDEPWDGPNNSKLLSQIPDCYQCPANWNEQGHCHYAAVIGQDTAWRPNDGTELNEFSGGTRSTLMVCETIHSIPWTKPEDVTPQAFVDRAGEFMEDDDGGGHPEETFFAVIGRHINLGFADGHVEGRFPVPRDPEVLRRLASRLDEYSPPNDYPTLYTLRWKWRRIIAVIVFLSLSLLPMMWLSKRTPEVIEPS